MRTKMTTKGVVYRSQLIGHFVGRESGCVRKKCVVGSTLTGVGIISILHTGAALGEGGDSRGIVREAAGVARCKVPPRRATTNTMLKPSLRSLSSEQFIFL